MLIAKSVVKYTNNNNNNILEVVKRKPSAYNSAGLSGELMNLILYYIH
jgi:hypothetical protein